MNNQSPQDTQNSIEKYFNALELVLKELQTQSELQKEHQLNCNNQDNKNTNRDKLLGQTLVQIAHDNKSNNNTQLSTNTLPGQYQQNPICSETKTTKNNFPRIGYMNSNNHNPQKLLEATINSITANKNQVALPEHPQITKSKL